MDSGLILQEQYRFYKELYMSMGVCDTDYIKNLDTPKISDELKEELDKEISVGELGRALYQMKNDKCPRTDGLSAIFYKTFWGKIKHLFHEVILEVCQDSILHVSARQGIISLLEKIGKCKDKRSTDGPL